MLNWTAVHWREKKVDVTVPQGSKKTCMTFQNLDLIHEVLLNICRNKPLCLVFSLQFILIIQQSKRILDCYRDSEI